MKNKKLFIGIVLALVLAAAWTWRYVTLNTWWESTIPDNYTDELYSIGDIVPFGDNYVPYADKLTGYSIRVDDFELVDYKEFLVEKDITLEYEPDRLPEKLALVYITLFNEDSDTEGVNLVWFSLHGIDQFFGPSYEILIALNPALHGGTGTKLHPYSEYSFVLVYEIRKEYMSSATMRDLENYNFYLEVTSFPEHKEIQVQ